MGRTNRTALVAVIVSLALAQQAGAQSLTFSLFERYLDSLRQQSGIPGLSAAIVQKGQVVWQQGFGLSDIERSIQARPDTPYQVAGLTESLSSSLLLEQCMETGHLDLGNRMQAWMPTFPEPTTTVGDILSHRSQGGTFKYDAGRYAALTGVIEACIQGQPIPFRLAIAEKIFDRLGMSDSVPAQNVDDASSDDRAIFSDSQLSRFASVLGRVALPYRVSGGSASVNTSVSKSVTSASGAVSTVLDLARYDGALDGAVLLHRDTMSAMWSNARTTGGALMPTGLGWFVQSYIGYAVYWQFGVMPGAYSSLIVKVPAKNLTLILLANSDGLSAPFPLQDGDVNASLFAKAFLRLFVG